jgi:hypothetical protein
MSYVPDPLDATEPLDSRRAKTAAAEFRSLKPFIRKLPVLEVSNNRLLTKADVGYILVHPSTDAVPRVWTLDSTTNQSWEPGMSLSFIVDGGAGTISLAADAEDQLFLAGAGVEGSRTLPEFTMCTVTYYSPNKWMVSGNGVG